ncbi:cation-translocating P-type ATPase [Paralcaligenes ureilyticus]|uniref:P-type Cu(+) transporter n=1 Tax=Paralcaligenes ureilyticus TaxID=627131 RepID=A0A4R3M969_9BURK|nr:cation-translocating P-type ATPase [Paralcaligenes ureilyticus]TCT10121.1 Ca2+-transporting ATPase [Paralcaligenes ureilyticus]
MGRSLGESVKDPTTPRGLTAAEAKRRLVMEGPNALPGSARKPIATIARDVLIEPMFLMLLTAGGIYLALGDRAEALFLLGFVVVVIGITLAQERKTQRALESLRDLSAPRALVIRDGKEQRVAGREVVRGDILVLREGDRIAADALMFSGHLEVNESLLTGEAVPVAKLAPIEEGNITATAPDTLKNDNTTAVFASTVVTRGLGLAKVVATGTGTAVGRIGADLVHTAEPTSSLQQSSRKLVRGLGAGALVLASIQTLLGWLWDGRPLLDSLLAGIALAMAILPEEIPVILTVFLAMGAWRISKQRVLTRRVSAVEALGAITVLAVDKTGTLTLNHMAVAELNSANQRFMPDAATDLPEVFHELIEFAMLATPGDPFDPMEKAIQEFGHHWLAGTEHVHDDRVPEFEYALSSQILAMTRVFASVEPTLHLLATKGAPEAVADLCHLDARALEAIQLEVEAMAERGLRVLGVARGRWNGGSGGPGTGSAWPESQHDFNFEFLGLVGLADPPRPEVPAAVAECRAAGIRLIMMTGDHPSTALAIARQVGLSDRPDVLTGAEITALDDKALHERLQGADLCARLQPAHKLRLVQVLRAAGEVVGMTGDGVNDAPALKGADIGIAMGERGTDVAREAAALVLLDDSFASIVAAIRQGRRISDNIDNATRFVFAVHVPIIGLALVPAMLQWPMILLPVHIVLLELLIDPACSIAFEAEPEATDVMSRSPRARQASPFSRDNLLNGVLQGFGLAAILLAGYGMLIADGVAVTQSRAVVFVSLILSVLLLILANRNPAGVTTDARNPWIGRMAVAVALMLMLVVGLPGLREIMGLALPGSAELAAIGLLSVLCAGWLAMARRISLDAPQYDSI